MGFDPGLCRQGIAGVPCTKRPLVCEFGPVGQIPTKVRIREWRSPHVSQKPHEGFNIKSFSLGNKSASNIYSEIIAALSSLGFPLSFPKQRLIRVDHELADIFHDVARLMQE